MEFLIIRQQASKGNCPLFALHSFLDCWLVLGLSGEGYNLAAAGGGRVGCCWHCHWMGVKWGVIRCFIASGVLFLNPGREALVDRVSSLLQPSEEFLTGCRFEAVGLLHKSCHQYKDTLRVLTLPYTFPSMSHLHPFCKWSIHAAASSPQIVLKAQFAL